MSLQKSELKAALLGGYHAKTCGLGTDADDELLKLEGAIGAFQLAAKTIETNKEFYRKQLLAEEITQDAYKAIMEVMDRDIGALVSLETKTRVEKQRKEGEVIAFKRVADLIARDMDAEREKIKGIKAALETGEILVEGDLEFRPAKLDKANEIAVRKAQAQIEIAENEVEIAEKLTPKAAKPKPKKPVKKPVVVEATPVEAAPEPVEEVKTTPQTAIPAVQRAAGKRPPALKARKRVRE